MCITKKTIVNIFGVLLTAILLGWSLRPVPLHIVQSNGTKSGSSTPPTVSIGTESHLLPFVRILNFILHPFRKTLVPLDVEEFKKYAINSLHNTMKLPPPYEYGDDFGDFLDLKVMEEMIRVCEEHCHFFGRFFLGV